MLAPAERNITRDIIRTEISSSGAVQKNNDKDESSRDESVQVAFLSELQHGQMNMSKS